MTKMTPEAWNSDIFYSDSGASQHVCGNRIWFSEYEPIKVPRKVFMTDGKSTSAIGVETVRVNACLGGNLEECDFLNVLHMEGGANLFSESVKATQLYGETIMQDSMAMEEPPARQHIYKMVCK